MKKFIVEKIKRVDPILFGSTLFLSLLSIITIFGAVENFGRSKLVMQSAMAILGVFMIFIIANIDYKFFVDKLYVVMFIASVVLLGLTLLLGSSGVNMDTANKSWLVLWPGGPMIQPSEFVKLTFICSFSKHLSMVRDKINKPLTVLFLAIHAGAVTGLILISGDLGVSLVYFGVILVMLFCSGLSFWYFIAGAVIIVAIFPFLWDLLAPYQQERIIYGFKPELDPFGYGLQPLLSREGIARGGLFGEGLFGGEIYEELPASHTDFIFSTVCEKFGFLGGLLCITALAVMTIRIIYIALHTADEAGKLICCGAAAVIILQTLENIGMCMALIPVVGITLPFMSAGGSSMLATYMLLGLVHSVRGYEKKFNFTRVSL